MIEILMWLSLVVGSVSITTGFLLGYFTLGIYFVFHTILLIYGLTRIYISNKEGEKNE